MEWFKMQVIWGAAVERLSDAEAGRFIKALFAFIERGEEFHGSGREEPTTCQALEQLRADKERLEKQQAEAEAKRKALSEKRRAAAEKRWAGGAQGWSSGNAEAPDGLRAAAVWMDEAPGADMQEHANACRAMQEHANASICMQMDAKCMQIQRENKRDTPSVGYGDGDGSAGAGENGPAGGSEILPGDPLALSGDEIAEMLSRDRQIEDAARAYGLPCAEGHLIRARELARQYTLPWLLRAIQTAGNGKEQTWRYVEGILRRYAQGGGPDAPRPARAAPGKTVSAQAYQQREYTEAQLTGISGDLLAEARRMRESAAAE